MTTLMRDDVSTLGWDKFAYLYCLAIPEYPLVDAAVTHLKSTEFRNTINFQGQQKLATW